jgi:signal transduction histidine kinase
MIARDLRIPFSQLLTYTDQLNVDLETLSATERHHLLTRLHQTARQTFRSVDNLLQWAMLETNTLPFHPTLMSIDRLITPIYQMFAAVARSKGIEIHQDIQHGLRFLPSRYVCTATTSAE